MTAQAFSIDGRTFSFEAGLAEAVPIGSYVTIDTDDGTYLGQVLESALSTRGPGQSDAAHNPSILGRGLLLSQVADGEFTGLDRSDVFGNGVVAHADSNLVVAHLTSARGSSTAIELGKLQRPKGVTAHLRPKGFGRVGAMNSS